MVFDDLDIGSKRLKNEEFKNYKKRTKFINKKIKNYLSTGTILWDSSRQGTLKVSQKY